MTEGDRIIPFAVSSEELRVARGVCRVLVRVHHVRGERC